MHKNTGCKSEQCKSLLHSYVVEMWTLRFYTLYSAYYTAVLPFRSEIGDLQMILILSN